MDEPRFSWDRVDRELRAVAVIERQPKVSHAPSRQRDEGGALADRQVEGKGDALSLERERPLERHRDPIAPLRHASANPTEATRERVQWAEVSPHRRLGGLHGGLAARDQKRQAERRSHGTSAARSSSRMSRPAGPWKRRAAKSPLPLARIAMK